MARLPQLLYLLEPLEGVTGRSGQHLRREEEHKTYGTIRELTQTERFDGTKLSIATVEIKITRLAAPRFTANWRIRDQYGVIYGVEGVAPSENRNHWLIQARRTSNPIPQETGRVLLTEDGKVLTTESEADLETER